MPLSHSSRSRLFPPLGPSSCFAMPLIRWDGGSAGRREQAERDRQMRIQQALERTRQERKREQELTTELGQEQQHHQERDKGHREQELDTLAVMMELGKEKPVRLWGVLKPPPAEPIDLD